jgi:hypothetical protein
MHTLLLLHDTGNPLHLATRLAVARVSLCRAADSYSDSVQQSCFTPARAVALMGVSFTARTAIGISVNIETQHELGATPVSITNNTCLLEGASTFSFTIRLRGSVHDKHRPVVVPCPRLLLRICHTWFERGSLWTIPLSHSPTSGLLHAPNLVSRPRCTISKASDRSSLCVFQSADETDFVSASGCRHK